MLARLRTVTPDPNGDRDGIIYTPGEVALRMFNAAGQAGHFHDMQSVNPSPAMPDYGMARQNATGPNGGHSLGNPTSTPRQAMKWSEAVAMVKQHQRRMDGRG